MAWHMHIGRSSASIASSLLILPHNSNLRFDDAARPHHLVAEIKLHQRFAHQRCAHQLYAPRPLEHPIYDLLIERCTLPPAPPTHRALPAHHKLVTLPDEACPARRRLSRQKPCSPKPTKPPAAPTPAPDAIYNSNGAQPCLVPSRSRTPRLKGSPADARLAAEALPCSSEPRLLETILPSQSQLHPQRTTFPVQNPYAVRERNSRRL